MKCPSCGYNTFDTYERCKRCGALFPDRMRAGKRTERVKIVSDSDKEEEKSQDLDIKELFEEQTVQEITEDDFIVLENEVGEESSDSEESFLTVASLTRRFFAFFIDISLIFLIAFVTLIFGLFAASYDPVKGIIKLSYIVLPVYVILSLLASTYLLFLHAYSGKTVGKLIFGIRVVKEDGSGINLTDSFVRWIGYYLSAIPMFYGYISALFDINCRTWHDKLSKSYVIRDN